MIRTDGTVYNIPPAKPVASCSEAIPVTKLKPKPGPKAIISDDDSDDVLLRPKTNAALKKRTKADPDESDFDMLVSAPAKTAGKKAPTLKPKRPKADSDFDDDDS